MHANQLSIKQAERKKTVMINDLKEDWLAIEYSILCSIRDDKDIAVSNNYINEHTIKALRYIGYKVGDQFWQNFNFVPHSFVKLVQY